MPLFGPNSRTFSEVKEMECDCCGEVKTTSDPDAKEGAIFGRGVEWWCGDCWRGYSKNALEWMKSYYSRTHAKGYRVVPD